MRPSLLLTPIASDPEGTVWEQRPLDPTLLRYSIQDVTLLPKLYSVFDAKLSKKWREKVDNEVFWRLQLSRQVVYYGTHRGGLSLQEAATDGGALQQARTPKRQPLALGNSLKPGSHLEISCLICRTSWNIIDARSRPPECIETTLVGRRDRNKRSKVSS